MHIWRISSICVLLFTLFLCCNADITLNWWVLQYPQSIPNWTIKTTDSTTVYGRIIAHNVTDLDPNSGGLGITAQLGWGLLSDPVDTWNWQNAAYNPGYQPGSPSFNSSMDEYQSFLQPNKIGSFRFTYRFSGNSGSSWVYADWTGSDDGFQVNETGTLTVISSGDLIPPNPVSGFGVTYLGGGFVVVHWNLNNENDIAGYDVYRRSVPGNFVRIGNTISFYINDTISFGDYEYKVIAYDTSYNYANDSVVVPVSYQATTGAITTGSVTTGTATTGSATTGVITSSVTTGTVTTGTNNINFNNTFPRCVRVNSTNIISFSARLCVDLQFIDCAFTFEVTADNTPIYSPPSQSISQFKDFFESDTENCNPGPLGCTVCTKWRNITLNEVEASGCGDLSLKCFGIPLGPFSLGCFRNTEVVPKCFGSCPNQCSYHGICDNAFCNCTNGYTGDDCSKVTCPGDCGGEIRGTCVNNICVCKNGFEGDACTLYVGQQSSSSTNSNWRPYVIGFVVSFGLLGIIIAVAFFLYKRNKKNHSSFGGLSASSSQVELEE